MINGASGGVGTFAVQIARAMGAEVTGVCSTRNVDMVRSLGADHVFDYKRENYIESGRKYDLIVDMVGNHSPNANRRVLEPGGKLVLVGGAKGDWLGPLLGSLKAIVLQPFVDEELVVLLAILRGEDLQTLAGMMEEGKLTVAIDRHYPLEQVPEALAYSEEGRARGKIVIDVE